MKPVLEGIKVLDFSRYISGPYASLLLADMGAEVIRVERPGGEDDRQLGPFAPNGQSISVMCQTRNKKGITLNLQSEGGRKLLADLVKQIDVIVENFGTGGKEAMGLDYTNLSKLNPGLIMLSISGFGTTGPLARRLAFDPVAQAFAGAMSITGFPEAPPTRSAVPWVDFGTGVYGALAVALALYHRKETGEGQLIDMAMLDTAVSYVAAFGVPAEYAVTGVVRPRDGNHSYYNFSNCFQARDGWVFISGIGDNLWRRLAEAIGKPEWGADPRFATNTARFDNRLVIDEAINGWIEDKTSAQAIDILENKRVPCCRVNSAADILDHPQVKAREMIVELDYPGVGKVPVSGIPLKLPKTPGTIRRRAPNVGEHNPEVYGELLGLSEKELAALRKDGAI
ncbi:MAG: CoA transferase [Dehalococcoidia bacterium]|nr:CoA transferase [Dehalococcoidia bacterium]